jgi:arabinan endo-1,5-alpha-L-arabinosidase
MVFKNKLLTNTFNTNMESKFTNLQGSYWITKLNFKINFIFLLILIFSFSGILAQPPSHDPSTMIRNTDGRYWIFTTGQGIWCMSSSNSNFTDWRAETTPFGSGYPSWIKNYVTGFTGSFWAPDVIKIGSYYYLYYSCAGTGAAAAIGVTRASNLAGPWIDQGMVYAGNNAIDPAVYMDNGRLWMTWGNWQEGIDICELSTSTGKRLNSTKTKLVTGQVEGPGLIKNGSYYYLFYQRGLCCNGLSSTYYMVVARSSSITGPYSGERTFLPNRSGNEHGPGHFGYGESKLTYHYYAVNDNGNAKLAIKTLGWSGGWPVVGGTSSTSIVSGGTYRITPRNSGKSLDVANCGTANGANVQQWSWLNNDCQQFVMTDVGSSQWRISPAHATGMSLDVTNCSTANSANIQLWSWLNNNCQKWQLIDMGSGYYQIKSVSTGKCLNVSGNSSSDGANIVQYTCGTANNMQFSFNRTKSTSTDITNNEVDMLNSVIIHPNPTSGVFSVILNNVNADEVVSLKVFNMQGKLVTQVLKTGNQFDVNSRLKPGSYILQIENNGVVIMKKLLVK